MAVPSPASDNHYSTAPRLRGERIAFLGKLTGMTRREACNLVSQHGAEGVGDETATASIVVIGDSQPDLPSVLQTLSDRMVHSQLIDEVAAGRIQLLHESELWHRIGLVGEDADASEEIRKLYTPAMLAELLKVPVTAVRRWHRQGTLVACRSVRRLPYFDFTEVAVARHLAVLYAAGCSLRVIDRKLAQLKLSLPDVERPLCDPSIVIRGRRLYLRRGDDLAEPGGQLLIDFDKPDDQSLEEEAADSPMVLSISGEGIVQETAHAGGDQGLSILEKLQQTALEWEDLGELERAAETYRTMLVANGPRADLHFALADLLYRSGELSAARERYYAAIELDEEYVEARANLGCVLVENDELELAVAAFEGALAFHPDYADVHYHLASALDRLSRRDEAELHWQTFLALAPENPWAEMARSRLGIAERESQVFSEPKS
ncbi:MAG: tetratricopeptide repeat protein [Pirellulales bacterium]|nr:tetratricopeptide repeat protein [Pirellulales bacterium]